MNESSDMNGHHCNCEKSRKCNCWHHKIAPGAIALIGVVFLLNALGVMSGETTAIIWPILLIVAGGTKAFERYCTCC